MLRTLRRLCKTWTQPIVGTFAKGENGPFRVLIATVLSLRTQDKTTAGASARLFRLADTPGAMLRLTAGRIEKAIYPVGFYRTKARNILKICRILLDAYGGRVPDDLDELLKLPGVGRKTANLVVTVAYGKHGICVDTHVHRISNRWGYVKTRTPHETEEALRKVLPKRYWIEYNDLLVCFGQNLCVPVSPFCGRCPLFRHCPRLNVTTSR
ncbi:MAG: endonuclease III [Omnitrophica WOR_2 bacterium RIFCSPHIGHO2_02_FULL_68_15]|nr:MAG: endonuclease III [Omnitrophica WOR_2 bacterium RIFCSPHIGHO2_02_FULL_68_15]